MKTFNHDRVNTSVCIHRVEKGILYGNFYNEQPVAGDFIKSFTHNNAGTKFEVVSVLNQCDSKIQTNCTHNQIMSKMELEVVVVLDN